MVTGYFPFNNFSNEKLPVHKLFMYKLNLISPLKISYGWPHILHKIVICWCCFIDKSSISLLPNSNRLVWQRRDNSRRRNGLFLWHLCEIMCHSVWYHVPMRNLKGTIFFSFGFVCTFFAIKFTYNVEWNKRRSINDHGNCVFAYGNVIGFFPPVS